MTKFLFEPRLVLKLWTPSFFRYFQKCAHFSSEPVHGPRNMKIVQSAASRNLKKDLRACIFLCFNEGKKKLPDRELNPGHNLSIRRLLGFMGLTDAFLGRLPMIQTVGPKPARFADSKSFTAGRTSDWRVCNSSAPPTLRSLSRS